MHPRLVNHNKKELWYTLIGGVFFIGKKGQKYRKDYVKNWIRKYREKGQIARQKRGRVKGTKINYKERYEILKKLQAFLEEQHEKK